MSDQTSKPKVVFIFLALVTAFVSIFSAVLMTEPGQSLNLPREWVFGYYANRWIFISINVALLLSLWIMNNKYKFVRVFWAGGPNTDEQCYADSRLKMVKAC